MSRTSQWAVVLLAGASIAFVASTPTRAESANEPATEPAVASQAVGSITGTVTKDGKPVAGARVGLVDRAAAKERQGKAAKREAKAAGEKPAKGQKPKPTITTTTDSEGKFTLNDVKAGDYMVIAGMKGEARGRSQASIVSGQTAQVEIQLTAVPEGGQKAVKPGKAKKTGNVN